MTLLQNLTMIGLSISTPFQAIAGTPPYTYSVLPGGSGGSIDPSTGVYTAPDVLNPNPALNFDTIQVTDSLLITATATIKVGNALMLLCDVLQSELGLAEGQVYLWDQKINTPNDSRMYVVIRAMHPKAFSNINKFDGDTLSSVQTTNFAVLCSVDIFSRGTEARDRKEEVVMALNSDYAQTQQGANSFYIAKLPATPMVDISMIDGAAIPYHYNISVNIQYFVRKTKAVDYYSNFPTPEILTNP